MAHPVFKRFRGYIAPALLGYTVLVTFLLVQTAWNDGTAVQNTRSKETTYRYVPSKEERRHLRSLEDVDGIGHLKASRKERLQIDGGSRKFPALQNGRKVQSSYTNDFYVDEAGNNNNNNNNNTSAINGSLVDSALPPGGRDYIMESRLYQSRSETMVRRKPEGDAVNEINHDVALRPGERQAYHPNNIEIEEMIPVSTANKSSLNSNLKNNKPASQQFRHHSSKDKKVAESNVKNRSEGMWDTHFCDNIEEDGKLCYRERTVYSHQNHVNISSTHQSFKSFAGLQIYSAFLDTRQSPASIRIMTIGAKGYSNGGSSLWCAFTSPLAVTKRIHWSGQQDNIATGQTQASQLSFYAASDGHNKNRQFYVMSCQVPDKYLNTLNRFDGNRIDIVAGTQDSALLDTIQERVPITVINNKGLSWRALREQAIAKERDSRLRKERGDAQNVSELRQRDRGNSNNNKNSNWIDKGSVVAQTFSRLGKGDKFESYETSRSAETTVISEANTSLLGSPRVQDAIVSCVAPIYGLSGIVQITEFIELTLLLGSQHIVFYTPRISQDVRQILNMYRDQGLVTVLPWNVPDATEMWAKGRDVALNDCLYRTMFLYDFALFHDVDEFLIPKATPDLPSFLAFLRTKGKMNTTRISDIVFNSAYFLPPTKAQSENLTTMPGYTKEVPKFISLRSLHRTYFSSQHTVRIIKPIAAMRVGAGERKRTTFNVNPRFAGVNHYTKCPTASTQTDGALTKDKQDSSKGGHGSVDCNHSKWDDVIWKFKDKLIQSTKDNIRAFNAQGRTRSR